MTINIDKAMLKVSAKSISPTTNLKSLEKKAIALISWTRRHGKSFSNRPLIDLVDGNFIVVNKKFYQPAIDKVIDLLKTESKKISIA